MLLFADTLLLSPYTQTPRAHSTPLSLTVTSVLVPPALSPSLIAPLLYLSMLSDPSRLCLCPSCISRLRTSLQAVCLCIFLLLISFISLLPWHAVFSCHSASISSLCLCQYLFLSLPLSHLNTLLPFSVPLCHASLLSPSLVSFVAPFITLGLNQEHLCLSLPPPTPPPLPFLRLSAADGNHVQSKPCSLPKNNNELRNHRGTRKNSSVFQETSRSLGTK